MWGGMYPGDNFWEIIKGFGEGNGVKETLDYVTTLEKGYHGISVNMVIADNTGDIGYVMLAPVPKRNKSYIPYISSRVLSGETTEFDWVQGELVSGKDYPRVLNPSKGYISTANNR